MNPIMVHRKTLELATSKMCLPYLIASKPRTANRTPRVKKLTAQIRSRDKFSAASAAITMVKGNGGGAIQARETVLLPCLSIILCSLANLFSPAIFLMPSSPSFCATRARAKTPMVEPTAACSSAICGVAPVPQPAYSVTRSAERCEYRDHR